MRRRGLIGALMAASLLVGSRAPAAEPERMIYLATGGTAYLELERSTTAGVALRSTSLFRGYESSGTQLRLQLQATSSSLCLTLLCRDADRSMPAQAAPWQHDQTWQWDRSASAPGDYDLVAASDRISDQLPPIPLGPEARLAQPFPSDLHRVDDPRVIEYLDLAHATQDRPTSDTRLEKLAASILASHPDDPYVKVLVLDSLITCGEDRLLAECVAKWQTSLLELPNAHVRLAFRRARQHVRARGLSLAGHNAWEFAEKMLGPSVDLSTRLHWFPQLMAYEQYAPPSRGLTCGPLNLLDKQTHAKVLAAAASLQLISGGAEQALPVLGSLYRYGQMLSQSPELLEGRIGVAVRSIAASRLEMFALNACQTPSEYQALWTWLEKLNQYPTEASEEFSQELRGFRASTLTRYFEPESTDTRDRAADTRFQLVRMAAAARCCQATQGHLPQSAADLGPLLPAGAPIDPFTSRPLGLCSWNRGVVCYSLGPDRQDNLAEIDYDPTNGLVSTGDIITRIPREREFAFTRTSLWALSPDDVRKRFPNGLPPDPFGDRRGQPLKVTQTAPIQIYSWGPDMNESRARADEGLPSWEPEPAKTDQIAPFAYRPTVGYDPTNGLFSAGDLFIDVAPSGGQ